MFLMFANDAGVSVSEDELKTLAKEGWALKLNSACQTLKTWLHHHGLSTVESPGQMFAVLLVYHPKLAKIGYLQAFSSTYGGYWLQANFVEPVFDVTERHELERNFSAQLEALSQQYALIDGNPADLSLGAEAFLASIKKELIFEKQQLASRKKQRQSLRLGLSELSNQYQALNAQSQVDTRLKKQVNKRFIDKQALFEQRLNLIRHHRACLHEAYPLMNEKREAIEINDLVSLDDWRGSVGDCCAIKLFHHANVAGLKPLAYRQFWWGASLDDDIRHHNQNYQPCRGKCQPLLNAMLSAAEIKSMKLIAEQADFVSASGFKPCDWIVYQDDDILVINKPPGLLSVPGEKGDSALALMSESIGADLLVVHRLDQATSGLLLFAKNSVSQRVLQQQFANRLIDKRYIALLSAKVISKSGEISLPLRVNLNDRPRQLVCHAHGKPSQTRWRRLAYEGEWTRVAFEPVTGRTHQLRLHAAHPRGLSAPIVGDSLYCQTMAQKRLHLHAESLSLVHPSTSRIVKFQVNPDF